MNWFNMLHGLWDTQIPLEKWSLHRLMWVQSKCSVNISSHGEYYQYYYNFHKQLRRARTQVGVWKIKNPINEESGQLK